MQDCNLFNSNINEKLLTSTTDLDEEKKVINDDANLCKSNVFLQNVDIYTTNRSVFTIKNENYHMNADTSQSKGKLDFIRSMTEELDSTVYTVKNGRKKLILILESQKIMYNI